MDDDLRNLADSDGVSVHNGFPNPAIERRGHDQRLVLDVNQLLIRHPSSTYLFRVSGHLWADQGIYDGDIAVLDRVLVPRSGQLVLNWLESGFNLYRYAGNEAGGQPWGVVTAIIHQYDA